MKKFWTLVVISVVAMVLLNLSDISSMSQNTQDHINQFKEHNMDKLMADSAFESAKRFLVSLGVLIMWVGSYWNTVQKKLFMFLPLLMLVVGCRKPFEPQVYEMVDTSEVGFLIAGNDVTKQASTGAEDYAKSLVNSPRVKIPQMWVDKGYNTMAWLGGWDGEWQPAARLIKVDTASVTREWTADQNSGTSDKNEAIWVMTSDQVEFSTGWTCTAKIASKEDAIKFLSNYRSGTLQSVMDTEMRAKIQAIFGLSVTDLPMESLKTNASPTIVKTCDEVTKFFAEKGITITNIGITGGFVYKDPKIIQKMVEVFTAEQEKSIAVAKTLAQTEENKRIQLEAEAKAKAILTEKQGEADAIKLVADAKAYEIEKAKMDLDLYLGLKRMELEAKKIEKWSGEWPSYFMGQQDGLNMMMQIPNPK